MIHILLMTQTTYNQITQANTVHAFILKNDIHLYSSSTDIIKLGQILILTPKKKEKINTGIKDFSIHLS